MSKKSKLREGTFKASDLVKIPTNFEPWQKPPFKFGDVVILNSGGPCMMVVDVDAEHTIAMWDCASRKPQTHMWDSVCLHKTGSVAKHVA